VDGQQVEEANEWVRIVLEPQAVEPVLQVDHASARADVVEHVGRELPAAGLAHG
jgi:hypothetical protein